MYYGVEKRDPIPEDFYNGIQSYVVSNNMSSIYRCFFLQEDTDNILRIVSIHGKHLELNTH